MLRQVSLVLSIRAIRPGLQDFTDSVASWVAESNIRDGLLTLFCRHTSASLVIQENAAPAARRDLEAYFQRIAPGWQGIFLFEHRRNRPERMIALHLIGA